MERLFSCSAVLFLLFLSCNSPQEPAKSSPPNIIYILADDMGYGDIPLYNPQSKIATPNLSKFASQGLRFTDAHAPAAVCTPTRYGILTGRYAFRSERTKRVIRGFGPSLIPETQTTVAELLKRNGYRTGCVGKWHLGVNWAVKGGGRPGEELADTNMQMVIPHRDSVDFVQKVTGGPVEAGFDYSFILPASLDMEPYCFLENNELITPPTDYTEGNDLNTGYTGAFWREGWIAPDFEFEQVLPTFIDKAEAFIEAETKTGEPFFLYLPLASPHTPWVPVEEFKNTSEAGPYGDFTQMVDAMIGKLLRKVDELGISEETLIIFTSDNGPYWRTNEIETYGHRAAGSLRGMKADAWEGGHRVPFLVRWPEKIKPGVSDQLTCLTDLMATLASLLGDDLTDAEGPDSYDILPVLLGENAAAGRESLISQSSRGKLAIRKGDWKYINGLGSGGFSPPGNEEPVPGGPEGQLYNLKDDPGETRNLCLENPEKVREMQQLLEAELAKK